MGVIRIIGGQLKGRRLTVLDAPGLRPTADRVRETLFNWLQFQINAKRCLDLFSGTGALGFEALSRGAAHVTFVEKNRRILQQIEHNARICNVSDQVDTMRRDANLFLKNYSGESYDIIFLDPPFHCQQLQTVFAIFFSDLSRNNLIHNSSIFYIECEKDSLEMQKNDDYLAAQYWIPYKRDHFGQVCYSLYTRYCRFSRLEL